MANKHSTLSGLFTAIADAIRSKTGGSDKIVADEFPEAISDLITGNDYRGKNLVSTPAQGTTVTANCIEAKIRSDLSPAVINQNSKIIIPQSSFPEIFGYSSVQNVEEFSTSPKTLFTTNDQRLSIAVDSENGFVYCGGWAEVYVYDSENGSLLATIDISSGSDIGQIVALCPDPEFELCYVGGERSPVLYCCSPDGYVVYNVSFSDYGVMEIFSIAVDSNYVYVGCDDSCVYAFDRFELSETSTIYPVVTYEKFQNETINSVIIYNNYIYTCCKNEIRKNSFDGSTDTEIWRASATTNTTDSKIFIDQDGFIYFINLQNRKLYKYADIENGIELVWEATFYDDGFPFDLTVDSNGYSYFLTDSFYLEVFDPEGNSVFRERVDANLNEYSALAIDNEDCLYLTADYIKTQKKSFYDKKAIVHFD